MPGSWTLRRLAAGALTAGLIVAAGPAGVASGAATDPRAYELVSPQDKNGGEVIGVSTRTRAAAGGGAVQFSSLSAYPEAQGSGLAVDYIAQRDGQTGTPGWVTHAISPPQEPLSILDIALGGLDLRYLLMGPDLGAGVYLAKSLIGAGGDNVASIPKLYVRNDLLVPGIGSYELVNDCLLAPDGPCAAPLVGTSSSQPGLAGASVDFRHVIFESTFNLTNEAIGLPTNRPKLYEWNDGVLALAGVLPDGTAAPSSAAGQGAGTTPVVKRYTPDVISEDGSRIVFTSPVGANGQGQAASDIYLRENGTTTIQINAEERTTAPDPPSEFSATFWGASSDLSRIFFTSSEQLTDDDLTEGAPDLFMYDATLPDSDPNNLTRLASVGAGVIGVSDAGDTVYFVADESLTAEACDSVSPCIFRWHEGDVQYVGRINSGTEQTFLVGGSTVSWVSPVQAPKTARMTPDGTRLVFLSEGTPELNAAAGLPGYDQGSSCQSGSGDFDGVQSAFGDLAACAEVYVYDATANGGAGSLLCASCNSAGARLTQTDAVYYFFVAGGAAGRTSYLNRAITDDGRFVFFSTGEPLVPEDVNGSVYDVYQYDTVTGEQTLLSTGSSPYHSLFLDASADGTDVFFRTREQLSGWDRDDLIDLYTARAGGGVPDPVAEDDDTCEGDACFPPQSGPLDLPGPGTAVFEDDGSDKSKAGRTAVYHVYDLGPKKLARWAKRGAVRQMVSVSDAGTLTARVRARIDGRSRVVARATRTVGGGRMVNLRLKLSPAARQELRSSGRLRVTIIVRYSGADGVQRAQATLLAR